MFSLFKQKFPSSVRLQQVFRYAKFVSKREEELRRAQFKIVKDSITSAMKQNKVLSVSEWKSLTSQFNKHHLLLTPGRRNELVFDTLFALPSPNEAVSNVRNFIEASNLSYDFNVKLKFVEMYIKKHAEDKLTDEEENEVIEICNEIISNDLNNLPEMHKLITQGLCTTREWKGALKLERHVSNNSLNILIRKAICEQEIDVLWELLNNSKESNVELQYIPPETGIAIAKYFERNPNADSFFGICESIKMVFDERSAHEFTRIMQRSGRQAEIVKIDFSGVCSNCGNTLDGVRITEKEFELVKSKFMQEVVKGIDIYLKTTPGEWQRFERVIAENGPFDIVIDGMNVGHIRLASAVQQLMKEGKRVLVLGRRYMNTWPTMDYIRSIAPVFLVDTTSEDDLFVLYAAISSGPNSYILTNDFMRDHKSAICKQFADLFTRWQKERRYGIINDENSFTKLIKPMQFKMRCHKSGDCWHLPFKSQQEIEANTWAHYELPENWACVRLKTSNQ